MNKEIYCGNNDGIYNVGPFQNFMKGLEGAIWVQGNPNTTEGLIRMIYHIKPGVTLKYRNLDDGGPAASDTVIINAYGEEENISKVETIILEAAEKFKEDK